MTAPRAAGGTGSVAEVVERAWAGVLGTAPGPDDDFYADGGTSLRAALVVARMRADGLSGVSVQAVMETPRFADLVDRLDRASGAVQAPAPLRRVDRTSPLPLSYAQEIQLLSGVRARKEGKPVHPSVLPFALRLTGTNPEQVRAALAVLVARHESLRMGFRTDAEAERIDPFVVPAVAPADLLLVLPAPDAGVAGTAELALAVLRGVIDRQSPPECPPLLAFSAYPDGDGLMLVGFVDHVVCDGISLALLLDELAAELAAEGEPRSYGRDVDFLDWAGWQRAVLAGTEGERLLDFWTAHLGPGGPLPRLEVPTPRDPESQPEYVELEIELDAVTWGALTEAGRIAGATRLAVVLTVLDRGWCRAIGGGELVVHVPTANRAHPEVEGLVGALAHSLPVRLDRERAHGFAAHLAATGTMLRDVVQHEAAPLAWLAERLEPDGGPQVLLRRRMFVSYEEPTPSRWPLRNGSMELVPLPWAPAAYDGVRVRVVDEGHVARLLVSVNGRLVDAESMRSLVRDMGTAVREAVCTGLGD